MENREIFTQELEDIYRKLCNEGFEETAEDILERHNASQDDSDPEEGFMVTMSDDDIIDAIADMEAVYGDVHPETLQATIYSLQSGKLYATKEYTEGFLDACAQMVEEYGIDLDLGDY